MELQYVYATAGLVFGVFALHVLTKRFDPFAPLWLFLVGYFHLYVIQAVSYHDWAVQVRGADLVEAANFRALWALAWFLAIYHCGVDRLLVRLVPEPPRAWSTTPVYVLAPILVVWGVICAGLVFRAGAVDESSLTAEEALLRAFPVVLLVGGAMLLVTGRSLDRPQPAIALAGLAFCVLYLLIWMFNGKRSHAVIGVLSTICALYVTRMRRPSWLVLATTAVLAALAVSVAIGWRNNRTYEHSASGFVSFLGDFDPSLVLHNLNIEKDDEVDAVTYETEEYGGFLLMMATVPDRSDYDYCAPYLRIFSTFIPRILWPSKPVFGREKWIAAWFAGSELERDEDFTGPAIGILGATQLNGGATATAIVLAALAIILRTTHTYCRRFEDRAWIQLLWPLTFYASWFMVVNDDPMIWFYYNWGFTTMPTLALLWIYNKTIRKKAAAAS